MNSYTIYVWSRFFPDYESRMKAIAAGAQWWLDNPDQCTLFLVPINH